MNDGSNAAKSKTNGRGQQNKAGGKSAADDAKDGGAKGRGPKKTTSNDFGNDDPAIMQTDGSTKSSRGRELEKFSFGGPTDKLGTLEDSSKNDS